MSKGKEENPIWKVVKTIVLIAIVIIAVVILAFLIFRAIRKSKDETARMNNHNKYIEKMSKGSETTKLK